MRLPALLIASLFLAACIGNPPRQTDPVLHDLGDADGGWPASGLALSGFRVRAVSWLDAPAVLYRLSYADDLSRRAYAGHRWVAPPAELFERNLQRRLVAARPDQRGTGCRVALTLDELEQRFSSAQQSLVVLDARATLLPPHGETRLARRAFSVKQTADTPDARGGVRATRVAADSLAQELARWLETLAREQPELLNLCKERR